MYTMNMIFTLLTFTIFIGLSHEDGCHNDNTFLKYLQRCRPEELQEAFFCVASGPVLRTKLTGKLICGKGKKIFVAFSAVSYVNEDTVVCERKPVEDVVELDACSEKCYLDAVSNECEGRNRCSLKLDEYSCLDSNLVANFNANSNSSMQKEYKLRVQYLCADETHIFEYQNDINYNSETPCQDSTTTTDPSLVFMIPDSTTTHLVDEARLEKPLDGATLTPHVDEDVLEAENSSSNIIFRDLPWTAKFLSDNLEKTVLYLVLGTMLGLVLVLILLQIFCCCYRKRENTNKGSSTFWKPGNSKASNVKQNRESQTLLDAPSYAPRMIRFQRDSGFETPGPGPANNSAGPANNSIGRTPTGAQTPSNKGIGWNRASDVPATWPTPPDHPPQNNSLPRSARNSKTPGEPAHHSYPKTPYPPAVIIANQNAAPFPQAPTSKTSPAAKSPTKYDPGADRDSVFARPDQEPLLRPKNEVWVRNSVASPAYEGPEGINFYPSVSGSPGADEERERARVSEGLRYHGFPADGANNRRMYAPI